MVDLVTAYFYGFLSFRFRDWSNTCTIRGVGVDQLAAIEGLIDKLDAIELATALRLREKLLAKTMRPLREFDAIGLYQLTKATSTKTSWRKPPACLPVTPAQQSPWRASSEKMPVTEAGFVDGALASTNVK